MHLLFTMCASSLSQTRCMPYLGMRAQKQPRHQTNPRIHEPTRHNKQCITLTKVCYTYTPQWNPPRMTKRNKTITNRREFWQEPKFNRVQRLQTACFRLQSLHCARAQRAEHANRLLPPAEPPKPPATACSAFQTACYRLQSMPTACYRLHSFLNRLLPRAEPFKPHATA
jgi:hypothetical protein